MTDLATGLGTLAVFVVMAAVSWSCCGGFDGLWLMTEDELKEIEDRAQEWSMWDADNANEAARILDNDIPALIAEVREAQSVIKGYVDGLVRDGDGQNVTCTVCHDWLDNRHDPECPGAKLTAFYVRRWAE